jgi:tetratricopeptide (TPR) repeat protein
MWKSQGTARVKVVAHFSSPSSFVCQMFERALVLRLDEIFLARILHGEDHPEYAMSLYNAAWLYSKLKLPEKACSYAERALAIRQKKLGPRHPHTIQAAEELKLYRRAVNDEEVARKMASDQRLCSRCSTVRKKF